MRTAALMTAFVIALTPVASWAKDFRLEDYFAGRTVAKGSFSTITGYTRSFDVKLTGRSHGRTFTLREDFVYSDGERDTKTWRFTKLAPGRYTGTREDVVGETLVTIKGDTATFAYRVYLDPKNMKQLVRFHDRMVLKPDGTVLNNALVTKFGFPVARTRVEFRRR